MKEDFVEVIRENYDRLAAEYSAHISGELQHKPLDCELLRRFAGMTQGKGEVCDMACGPGHVARFLHGAKADVFGLDLSPGMVEQARKLCPEIRFREGNMMELDLPDASLAGITAMYAIVNIPEESLAQVFREMRRVLKPGGVTLIAFHVGDEEVAVPELWGQKVTMPFFFRDPSKIRTMLEHAGLNVEEVVERDPYPEIEFQSRRAYIFARRP
ncbi:MAG TPA: class I SAM-dependent methyltransferase [Terriglobales bacterium]|nr:class I SAM-dependent methyltransferase [Terriglobales bacterium]